MEEDEEVLEEVEEPSSFEDLKKLALEHPDFVGKFKALKNTSLKPENLGSLMQISQSFMEKLSADMLNNFQISKGAEGEYLVEWEKLTKFSSTNMFDGLKLKFEAVAQTNKMNQIVTSQVLAYMGLMVEKQSDELNRLYSGEINIEDDKADKFLKAFENANKALKELEPFMKELKKQRGKE